ncbi:MAG: LemA family protein [Eubacterium sp.]|nr:LemA family protein [Eubacterium sp.]
MLVGGIIGGIVLLLIIVFIACYNGLVRKRAAVEEGFSTMDVYMKKRFDLIPNLVETVKGYAKHEKETLDNIIKARGANYADMTPEQKLESAKNMSRMIPNIMALAESYPELKANQNFMQLSAELSQVEQDIANARKYYNGCVKNYNIACEVFPSGMIAGMFGFKKATMYEVSDAAERENVKVSFD